MDLLDVFSRFDAINVSSISGRYIPFDTTATRDRSLQTRFHLKYDITNGADGGMHISFRLVDANET